MSGVHLGRASDDDLEIPQVFQCCEANEDSEKTFVTGKGQASIWKQLEVLNVL